MIKHPLYWINWPLKTCAILHVCWSVLQTEVQKQQEVIYLQLPFVTSLGVGNRSEVKVCGECKFSWAIGMCHKMGKNFV